MLTRYDIKNKEVLDILEKFRYTFIDELPTKHLVEGRGQEMDRDYYLSDVFRDKIINQGKDHSGSADRGFLHFMKPDKLIVEGEYADRYRTAWRELDTEINTLLGSRFSALSSLYPPKGWIGWHNNADCSSYNLIFTWSETGDGQFIQYDRETKRNDILKDKKGWSLKAGYFGSYDDDKLVYHCAKTECWRMTLSYVFNRGNQDYWKDCIDFITGE